MLEPIFFVQLSRNHDVYILASVSKGCHFLIKFVFYVTLDGEHEVGTSRTLPSLVIAKGFSAFTRN